MSSVDPRVDLHLTDASRPTLARRRIQELRDTYRRAMFDDFVPWWQEHSLDTDDGGYFTRLDRAGRPYSHDKDMWLIGRQVWMFAHLYNTYEQRPLWLEIARMGAEFLLRHGFRPDGRMCFRTNRQGQPLATILSVYTKVFAAIGLAEFGLAADDRVASGRAIELYDQLEVELGQLSDTPLLGYPLDAEFDLHSRHMCMMTVAQVFNEISPSERFATASFNAMRHILARHWKPERAALLENVGPNGEVLFELPEGRLINPGHALESAWMMLEIASRDQNQPQIESAVDVILASLESGWDDMYGGIVYFKNIDDTPCHNIEADCKLWWPHGEALYATLLGWVLTGRPELAQWYERVHSYTFSSFPDAEFGEWYGYLNRDGSPIWTAKANGWKGFFHVPRIVYRAFRLLGAVESDLAGEQPPPE